MAKKPVTKLYEVELQSTPSSGAKKTMWRGGRQFIVKVPQVLELTKEEAEVYSNDSRFKLSETDGSTAPADESQTTSDSESDAPVDDSETTEEDSNDEAQDSEDSTSDDTEEDSDESPEALTVDELVKNNTRKELDALAVEAGVEAPESYETKPEVAQAIVDAQANNAESEATS